MHKIISILTYENVVHAKCRLVFLQCKSIRCTNMIHYNILYAHKLILQISPQRITSIVLLNLNFMRHCQGRQSFVRQLHGVPLVDQKRHYSIQ